MQRKKNIQLLISLTVLIALTAFVYWSSKLGTSKTNRDIFKVERLSEADRIVLKGREEVQLQFDGVRWRVNDEEADRNLIDVLFATLQQVETKRRVAKAQEDSITQLVKEQGVRVSIYGKDELLMDFVAGGNAQKTQALFLDTDENIPYVVGIPGYRVYSSGIFELDKNGWKDKRVFNFNWRNFESLTASFPDDPDGGFEIAFHDGAFSISGMLTDTAKLNTFLDDISLLTVDQFIDNGLVRDSLMKFRPAMQIEVKNLARENFNLTLYKREGKESTFGLMGDSQWVLFDSQKLVNLYRKKSYYRPELQ